MCHQNARGTATTISAWRSWSKCTELLSRPALPAVGVGPEPVEEVGQAERGLLVAHAGSEEGLGVRAHHALRPYVGLAALVVVVLPELEQVLAHHAVVEVQRAKAHADGEVLQVAISERHAGSRVLKRDGQPRSGRLSPRPPLRLPVHILQPVDVQVELLERLAHPRRGGSEEGRGRLDGTPQVLKHLVQLVQLGLPVPAPKRPGVAVVEGLRHVDLVQLQRVIRHHTFPAAIALAPKRPRGCGPAIESFGDVDPPSPQQVLRHHPLPPGIEHGRRLAHLQADRARGAWVVREAVQPIRVLDADAPPLDDSELGQPPPRHRPSAWRGWSACAPTPAAAAPRPAWLSRGAPRPHAGDGRPTRPAAAATASTARPHTIRPTHPPAPRRGRRTGRPAGAAPHRLRPQTRAATARAPAPHPPPQRRLRPEGGVQGAEARGGRRWRSASASPAAAAVTRTTEAPRLESGGGWDAPDALSPSGIAPDASPSGIAASAPHSPSAPLARPAIAPRSCRASSISTNPPASAPTIASTARKASTTNSSPVSHAPFRTSPARVSQDTPGAAVRNPLRPQPEPPSVLPAPSLPPDPALPPALSLQPILAPPPAPPIPPPPPAPCLLDDARLPGAALQRSAPPPCS
eukprot:scaffold155_cov106-Isochrysis_galbana.AAC.5